MPNLSIHSPPTPPNRAHGTQPAPASVPAHISRRAHSSAPPNQPDSLAREAWAYLPPKPTARRMGKRTQTARILPPPPPIHRQTQDGRIEGAPHAPVKRKRGRGTGGPEQSPSPAERKVRRATARPPSTYARRQGDVRERRLAALKGRRSGTQHLSHRQQQATAPP